MTARCAGKCHRDDVPCARCETRGPEACRWCIVAEIQAEDAAHRHLIPAHLLPFWDEWVGGALDEAQRVAS